ncbi:hypothetical protein [Parasynechococcus sp.]|uniref:hypothetical protein n=1 Tax=Parasynechococcus sp. TaxID=3101203 RepID=UPI0037040367
MSGAAATPDAWKEWLLQNRDRGCDPEELMQPALDQGFARDAIAAVLQSSMPDWFAWFEASLTRQECRPRAWRLDTSLAQVYELPGLLSHEECEQVIDAINASLQPSTVTRVSSDYRTSRTCHLRQNHPQLAASLDQRFATLFGVGPRLSEPIQGQRYDPGMALAWNNLQADGTPNPITLHEALPVEAGQKLGNHQVVPCRLRA